VVALTELMTKLFKNRILPFDERAAIAYAPLVTRARAAGKVISVAMARSPRSRQFADSPWPHGIRRAVCRGRCPGLSTREGLTDALTCDLWTTVPAYLERCMNTGTLEAGVARQPHVQAVQRGYKVLYREAHQLDRGPHRSTRTGRHSQAARSAQSRRAAAHRRPVPAQTPRPRRRRARRRVDQSLREGLHHHHLESTARGPGPAPWRRGGRYSALDRLMHHGHLLKFEGKSWRLKEAAARQNQKETAAQ